MRQITKTIYKYDELPTEKAKEKARDWYREGNQSGYDWWEFIYDDAATIGEILGINLKTRPAKRGDGSTFFKPNIYFSGFHSQGDGACFEGSYSYAKDAPKKIREYAPNDKELHRIAAQLEAIQVKYSFALSANVEHTGHYYHAHSTTIMIGIREDVSDDINQVAEEDNEDIQELLRDFMKWIYSRLEKEDEWLNSDENVVENIRANEYEFDENGEII